MLGSRDRIVDPEDADGMAKRPSSPRSRMRLARTCALAMAMAVVLSGPGSGVAVAASAPSLFGTHESRSDDIKLFTQWVGVLQRTKETPEPFANTCERPQAGYCHLKDWTAFLESLKGKDRSEQLDAVNRFMNRFPYIEDIVNWGIQDYWETPLEFLRKSGDCEDYAIAKYMSLRYLGWPADVLRVVVVQDLNLHVGHAILAVYTDDMIRVLDNQSRYVMNARNIHHYRPIYSINEKHWWLHRG
jgi:predicted transglutaminase-like cysteine proteinase